MGGVGGICFTCGAPHPGTHCAGAARLRDEMVVSRFDGGTVFRGSGNSHVTFAGGGAHITTEVPNLRLGDDGTRELKDFLRTDVPLRGY